MGQPEGQWHEQWPLSAGHGHLCLAAVVQESWESSQGHGVGGKSKGLLSPLSLHCKGRFDPSKRAPCLQLSRTWGAARAVSGFRDCVHTQGQEPAQ